MAADRERPTLTDYVITALSPALIMGLVGSLAFFLLEVCYQGQYTGRLMWTLFFFVFGAVLVSRIAITLDQSRAWLYGLALGGAVYLALMKFMEYPPGNTSHLFGWLINLALVVVVSWSANKLTWDCTFIDEKEEDAGRGLMTEIGQRLSTSGPEHREAPGSEDGKAPRKSVGMWVVYFSLAALPLFGLGQSLVPATEAGRRRYVFWLLALYVGCGLGLLMTTSLLSIRRYLRQRRQSMPRAMTTLWLGAGAGLIVAFLVVGALLPRPLGEYQLVSFSPLGSPERDASRYAIRSGDAGKGEGQPGAKGKEDAADAKDGSGGQGQAGGKDAGQTGKAEGGSKGGDGSRSGKGGHDSKQGGDGGKGKTRDAKGGPGNDQNKTSGANGSKSNAGSRDNSDRRNSESPASPPQPPNVAPPNVLTGLANVLKWIVLIVLGVLVVGLAAWFLLKNLSAAHQWARDLLSALAAFWQSLFGGRRRDEVADDEQITAAEVVERPRPFADFPNPFADGSAAGQSPEQLVSYSFAALEAWAGERDLTRREDETPLEFAHRLGQSAPQVDEETRQLAGLYVRMAYARLRLPEGCRTTVERFWQRLT